MLKHGWRGYVFSRPMGGNVVPQRVQNLVLRDYAKSQGLHYLLSATEYGMAGCYVILKGVMAELDSLEGILFYSTHQLPEDDQIRQQLYDRVLQSQTAIHFALERMNLVKPEDCHTLEDLIMVRRLARQTDTMPLIAQELP